MNYTQLQVDFLAAIGKLEERTDSGDRRIDEDPKFLENVVKEAKKPLHEIQKARLQAMVACQKGVGKKKPDFLKKAVMERCKHDILYWIDNWTYILNPHLTKYRFPWKLPFILFPKQVEYIKWKEELYAKNKGGLVYKCRDVGVSWLNIVDQAWHWFFESGFQGRFGSLKAEEVDDKNDPDSLFQKLRVIIYNTPWWMRPEELRTEENKHDIKMKIYNPSTHATISGQQGDNMGRGGRASMYDVDEWAKVTHDKLVDANLASNCPCVFFTGTPMGRDNDYAEKLESGKISVFEFSYWDDPRKTKDWFQNYSETHDESVVQQEVLKSLDSFRYGTCIPSEWVQAAITLYGRIKEGIVPYTSTERVGGLDVAAGGANRTVMLWREGIVVEEAMEWNIRNSFVIADEVSRVATTNLLGSVYFDPNNVGHGVRSAFEIKKRDFRTIAADARSAASEVPLDGDTKPARERCVNRRAEMAERLRMRFQRTYEYITDGTEHAVDSMVAISPDYRKLISQLSIPERFSEHGKIRLEPKEHMVRRGVQSPDYFDACMMMFSEEIEQKHVVKSFNPQGNNIVIDDEMPVQTLVCASKNQNYISIYHSRALSVSVLGAVWDGVRLSIYDEFTSPNTTISQIVYAIRRKFPINAYEYVGNKEIFQEGKDDLFMQYLSAGLLLQENFLYDELSAVAVINQMFDWKRIRIARKCISLIRQLDNFARVKGVPDKTNMETALALCNLVNRLKEVSKIPEAVDITKHYTRRTEAWRPHVR
jgi:hypothetical protein